MELLNSTMYDGKEFSIEDVRGFIEPIKFGLPVGFYGGRVDQVAKTDDPEVFLLVEKHKVIDILIKKSDREPETKKGTGEAEEDKEESEVIDYTQYTNDELRTMLLEKGIEAPKRAIKEELIALFTKEEE